VSEKKWWERVYTYIKDGEKVRKEFYDISVKDAFYIWYRYKQKANNKIVSYDFWKLTRWEIRPEDYFKFLREEGYKDFLLPHEILSGEGYEDGRKEFNIECDLMGRCIGFKNKEHTSQGVYVRLNELVAYINSNQFRKFERPKNPNIKFKRKPCLVCGAMSQKECICKRKKVVK